MDEILKKLLESEMLGEDVKAELKNQWSESLTSLKESLREEAVLEVRAELSEQWVKERDALIEGLDTFAEKKIQEELTELKEDISNFRDLEAEFAGRLVEEKKQLAAKLSEELDQLVDKIDEFFELRLEEEMSELKEDIQLVRENQFGRKVFESFVTEFNKSFVDEKSIQRKLSVSEDKISDLEKTIAKLEESVKLSEREKKLEEVLSSLSGSKREQMAYILKSVETEKLEEAYKMFIGRVLKEEKEVTAVITESVKDTVKTTVATGDVKTTAVKINEGTSPELRRALDLAGVK